MVQQYKKNLAAFALGRRVNMEEWNTRTGVASETIGFGVPVEPGPLGGRQVKNWDGVGPVSGITEASQVLPRPGDQFVQYDNLAFCESGVIGVMAGTNVVAGSQAYFDTTSKKWVATDTATSYPVEGATYDAAGVADTVVPLRYRHQQPVIHPEAP